MKFLSAVFFLSLACSSSAQSINDFGLHLPLSIKCTPVKDQYMSSTCWSFSSMSLLESELIKKGKGKMDLSEMFVARYSMVRKIQRHLKLKGNNFFTPGGQFHDAVWVMKNYGMAPEEIYSGKGRGETKHDHSEMDTLLSHFTESCVQSGITELSQQQQLFIDSVLDHYYGTVPKAFIYKGKNYTPVTYLKEYLGINPNDYIEVTSYTHHPFYTKFVLEDKYNWTGDEYYNVPLSDFSAITDNALKGKYTVGWDGDADDPEFYYYSGLAFLSDSVVNFQQKRQEAFEDHSTLLDHMMHIVATVKDKLGKKWYYVKNSWGNTNSLGGYLFMRDDYFKMRTVAIIVNKAALPAATRKKMRI